MAAAHDYYSEYGKQRKLKDGQRRVGDVVRHELRNLDGQLVAVHCRQRYDDSAKRVWWELPDGRLGLDGCAPQDLPNYGTHEIGTAARVIVVEGEPARDALQGLLGDRGIAVVGTVTGAGKGQAPSAAVLGQLGCAEAVYLWPDNDAPGAQHMNLVARRAAEAGLANVRVIVCPDAPEKGDAADFVAAGGTAEDIERLVAASHEPGHTSALAAVGSTGSLTAFAMTDVGNAERFAAANADRAVYCEGRGWFGWDGQRYRWGAERAVDRFAMQIARQTHHAAVELPAGHPNRDALIAHARRSEHAQRLRAMIDLARSLMLVESADLDRDPWLLNCANGTVDLRTGELRTHDPADLITKISPVPYDPDAPCPTWEAFLRRAMAGNEAMVAYLQEVVGIFLTGDVSEKFLPIIWGPSDTGKTTLTETVFEVLGGDYAQPMAESTIAKADRHRGGGEATPELARLVGVRLAVVSETSAAMQLNAARVKAMTGRNKVTARNLFQSPFDFVPTHKLLIETNDRPGMRDGDAALFNRVHLIPFEVVIPKDDQDPTLPARLRDELPGILAWAVRGCLAWQRKGHLARPPEVANATIDYQLESDLLSEFVEDRCVVGQERSVSVTELFKEYRYWARGIEDDYPVGKHRFNALMAARPGVRREGRVWRGIDRIKTGFDRTTEEATGNA